ncbi:PfkB family carbohydrate kinase, partial [Moraxella cuniculi]|uniref:PfkB family carbohydrate kinase n=1 Tax=Moraxella cuniculi TaxID=34061 RepID=UPI000993FF88
MYDVVAIGNALVDTEFTLSDAALAATNLVRGNMTLADADAQAALFATLSKQGITPAKQAGGGSAANSMFAFASLGGSAFYNCRVGGDDMGDFYLADLANAGVATDADFAVSVDGITGSCAVLVSPDGERTMQTHLGTSSQISAENVKFDTLAQAKWLYLEGYLAMSPSVMPALAELHKQARQAGAKIAVSFADPAVVKFAKDGLLAMLERGVDAVFCNFEEANLFAEADGAADPVNALLKYSELVVITNSDKPTTIACRGERGIESHQVASQPVAQVIDTNGAGDNYAGAFLYGLSQGLDLVSCANLTKATAGSTALTVTATDAASNDTNKTRDYVIDLSQETKDQLAKEESVDGDSNITVTQDKLNSTKGKNFNVSLNKDVDLTKDGSLTIGDTKLDGNSLKVGGNNPVTIDGNKGTVGGLTNTTWNPDNITTGQAATEDQLKTAAAAAKTEVKAGENVTVTSVEGDDKQTIYTVNAKDTSAKVTSATDKVTVNAKTAVKEGSAEVTEYELDLSAEAKEQLAKEESVDGDSNITVTQDKLNSTKGKNFNVSLNKDVNLTDTGSLTIGDTVVNTNGISTGNTAMTPDGIVINGGPAITHDNQGNFKLGDINSGEPVKITNLKAGEADNDAVNVSQLKAAQAAATTKVEGDQGVTVTPETNKDGSTTYTVAAKTDGTTVKVDGNGNIAAVTSDITTNTDGSSTATTPSSLVTAGDVAKAINNSGWKLAADGTAGTELINPADTVTFKAKDNLNVSRDGANITYGLNKDVDLTKDGSLRIGETALTKDGLIINNGPMLVSNGNNLKVGSVDGDTVSPIQIQNVDSGLKDDKGNVVTLANATGDVLNNVVNVGDLKSASDNLNKDLTEKGFNITADNSALDNNETEDNVHLGQTVKFTDPDKNIVTTVADNEIRFGLNNTIQVGEKGEPGKDGKDGTIGVNGKDGSAVVINGKDGSIGLNGKDGENGLTLKGADGAQGVDGTNGANGLPGKDGVTRLVYETKDPQDPTKTVT